MKAIDGILRSLLSAAFLLAAAATAHAADLRIFNWTDYTAPALIAAFQHETGITVSVDTYDSNETLLAKLKTASAGYDLVVITSDFVPIFTGQGLLQPIDATRLPHFSNIEPRWRAPAWDRDNRFTVPFHWGVTGFAYNSDRLPDAPTSLRALFEPPPALGREVGMLASPSEVVSEAELFLGLAPCQTEPAAMKKVDALLQAQQPAVRVYSSDGLIERLASGETIIQQIWNGDAARARANNPAIRFVFPREGVVGWMDNLAIPRDARNPEAAKRFIDFTLRPENSALSANFTHYATAVTGAEAFYAPDLKAAPELRVPPDERIVFTPTCPPAATRLMDRVWTRLRR